MATEKYPWFNKYTAGVAVGLTVAALLGILYHFVSDPTASFLTSITDFFSRSIPVGYGVALFLAGALAVIFIFRRMALAAAAPKQHATTVEGVIWLWRLFAGDVDLIEVPLCPVCRNELAISDVEIQTRDALAKYPPVHVSLTCSRGDFKTNFAFPYAELFQRVAKELRRQLRTGELKP